MQYTYIPEGVCPCSITVELEGDIVKNVAFEGGCDGNLKAISKVSIGMTVQQVEEYFADVTCEDKGTSCSAQMAKAVRSAWDTSFQNITK
ncbi:MAG: TIGR03905 family protein [Clostridiales bacterium 43-6]|nr:MAG: TIGR03905 family protein [Clostridiales bacterium 43-6]